MKTLRFVSILLLALSGAYRSHSQTQLFYLTITDSTAIDHIDTIGTLYLPTFIDPGVNGAFGGGGGNVSISQAMPYSDNECLRRLWIVDGADSGFLNTLVASFPDLFPGYSLVPEYVNFSHTPNDWNGPGHLSGMDYLDFIGARDAWDPSLGGTQGDSTVIIGISDDYFNMANPELRTNTVGTAISSAHSNNTHGTPVAGLAAGRTKIARCCPRSGTIAKCTFPTPHGKTTTKSFSE